MTTRAFWRLAALPVVVLLLSGCVSTESLGLPQKEAKPTSHSRTYSAGYDRVWYAALAAVDEAGLELLSQDMSRGEILALKGSSTLGYGDSVMVLVKLAGRQAIDVTVSSERSMTAKVTGKSDPILDAISAKLGG